MPSNTTRSIMANYDTEKSQRRTSDTSEDDDRNNDMYEYTKKHLNKNAPRSLSSGPSPKLCRKSDESIESLRSGLSKTSGTSGTEHMVVEVCGDSSSSSQVVKQPFRQKIKMTLLLLLLYIIISTDVFIEQILSNFSGATYMGSSTTTGVVISGMFIIFGYMIFDTLITNQVI